MKYQNQISVLLPFTTEVAQLNESIKSIVNQTFPGWELILVGNNATDKALDMAEDWVSKDSRIKLIIEDQQGIAHALNKGLEFANNDLIARMDADDIALPERFEKQRNFILLHDEIDVVSTRSLFKSDIESSTGYKLFVDWQNKIITPEEHFHFRFIESPIAHPTVMFRKTLISRFGNYRSDNVPEDYELWLRWMENNIRFYKIPEKLLIWNDHSGRLSRNHPDYSKESFFTIKCDYLARWILREIPKDKKIVVCGASKICRKRAALIERHGIKIFGYTDVVNRKNKQIHFIPHEKLTDPNEWFIINFIGKRGVGQQIREHFSNLGFQEYKNFILAA